MNKPRKQPIADLPRGVSVARVRSGSGVLYWRVRLGKKFTGGSVKRGDYVKLEDARVWIFGDAQKERAPKEGILQMVDGAKEAINGMSSKQITEAAAAFHRLKGSTLSLSAAVDFALRNNGSGISNVVFIPQSTIFMGGRQWLSKDRIADRRLPSG